MAAEGSRVRIVLQVEDTGVGIAPEAQKNLFQPFVQADSSTTRHFGGTGLGLAITQRLAEAMEGHIELRSAIGEGSTFTLECFAEHRQNGGSTPRTGSDERKEKPDMKKIKGRVLVVEDALPNQKLAEKMLQLMGLDVEIAENGQVGVDMYQAADYDLVLMDLQMPVMDGYHATQAIRRVQENRSQFRPICAVTANVTADDRAKCQNVGMDGFLGKPYNFSQLRSKVEELLESSLQPTS
jgi:CheY-like chemotaxis protein